jgi:dissimilatory sulfite reductase related protein
MATREIAGKTIEFDDEGFMKNPKDWSKEVCSALAVEQGITLSDVHWKVIEFARDEFNKTNESPTLRRITKSGVISTKDLYAFFPNGPAAKIAKLAGLHKPTGCI